MTEHNRRSRKLSHQILGMLGIVFVISFFLFHLLNSLSYIVVNKISEQYPTLLTEIQLLHLDSLTFNLSLIGSVLFFALLFLFLLGDRLTYIRDITKGIQILQTGQLEHQVPIEGNNELTQLAKSINYLSQTQQEIKAKEKKLKEEKEQFIRTMSHDIRTPLTSVLAYTELLLAEPERSLEEQKEYLRLIQKKATQIKEMTDILLDGGKRNLESFKNGRLLMEQLAGDFEAALEDDFQLATDLSGCADFHGCFDIQELQRIFDNLISNIQKYADPNFPVILRLYIEDSAFVIQQSNSILSEKPQTESYQMGLNSIRRIAHNYSGQVDVSQNADTFCITITLSDIS